MRFRPLALRLGFAWALPPAILTASLSYLSTASAQDVEVSDKARGLFQEGVAQLSSEHPDYAEAYRAFAAAYDDSPSWKILGNLGIAAMKLERDGEAIEAFQQYVREGKPTLDAESIEQFESDLKTLQSSVAWVTLSVPAEAEQIIDRRTSTRGEIIENAYPVRVNKVRLGVRSGLHEFELVMKDGRRAKWSADLAAGSRQEHEFTNAAFVAENSEGTAPSPGATSPEDGGSTRPLTTGVYVGLATTGAFAVGATVTGILALGQKSKFDDSNDGTQFDTAESAQKSAQTLGLVTDILWGATALSAGVTTYLFFTRPEAPQNDTALRVSPLVGPGTFALSVQGGF